MARNKYPEITRSRILEAAIKLFWEKGWEETTVQDIVDELKDVTRGAFYHHFQSKDDIINAVTTEMFRSSSISVFEEIDNLNISGLEKLRHIIIATSTTETQIAFVKAATSVVQSPIIIGKQVKLCIDESAPQICKYIEEGNCDGSLSVSHPKQASETFSLLANLWLSPVTFNVAKEEYKEKVKHFKDLFDNLGLPVVNDDMITFFEKFYDNLLKIE